MKLTQLSLAFFVAISLISCKKDNAATNNTPGSYYFTITKNGATESFTTPSGGIGTDPFDNTKTELSVEGVTGVTDAFSISIDLPIGSTFHTGTYNSDTTYSYQMSANEAMYTAGYNYDIADSSYPVVVHSKYILTITSITPTTITGTFTGNYLYDYSDALSVNITQGSFNILRLE
jgi:hypothetical protein